MTWAIQVEKLSKRYRLGEYVGGYHTLRDTLAHRARSFVNCLSRWRRPSGVANGAEAIEANGGPKELWALKDISLEIPHGEAVGIIGRNGSGKSTLLKILSRITGPTSGLVRVRGRVGSLLEVGAGFHQELTGRENIFLNAAILGMTAAETRRRFDEIVAFAGVEKFLDTPTKRYSSGMYVRLAFSIAAHLNPDILVVDEVLAVGDLDFQQKCLGKMNDSVSHGRTVLFVSHNLPIVNALTKHCIYLADGELRAFGPTSDVISQYLNDLGRRRQAAVQDLTLFRRKGLDGTVQFRSIRLASDDGQADHLPVVPAGRAIALEIELESLAARSGYIVIHLTREGRETATTLFSGDLQTAFQFQPGNNRIRCCLPAVPWAPGVYLASVRVCRSPTVAAWDWLDDMPLFEIVIPEAEAQRLMYQNRPWGAVHLADVCWEKII